MFWNTDIIETHRTGTLHSEVAEGARVLAASFRYVQACPKAFDGNLAVGTTAYRPMGIA